MQTNMENNYVGRRIFSMHDETSSTNTLRKGVLTWNMKQSLCLYVETTIKINKYMVNSPNSIGICKMRYMTSKTKPSASASKCQKRTVETKPLHNKVSAFI